MTTPPQNSSDDDDDNNALLMEKIVASRMESHEADRILAEKLHQQQLQERIRELQAQLELQKRQQQQQQQQERVNPETSNDEKVFFARNTANDSNDDEHDEDHPDDVSATEYEMPTAPRPLQDEQESLMLLDKIVQMRAGEQAASERPSTTSPLEEQESVMLLNKIVAMRAERPLERTQTQQIVRLKEQVAQQQQKQQADPLATTSATRSSSSSSSSSSRRSNSRRQRPNPAVFPGAVRVGGSNGNAHSLGTIDETIHSSAPIDDSLSAFEDSVTAVESDIEQARIRNEILQQAPEALCFVAESKLDVTQNKDNDDDKNENNKKNDTTSTISHQTMGTFLIGIGVCMLVLCVVVIVVLVVLNTGDSKNPQGPTLSSPAASPTTAPATLPTVVGGNSVNTETADPNSSSCPCSFDTTTFVNAENEVFPDDNADGGFVPECGPLHILKDSLLPGQFGMGICFGAGDRGCGPLFGDDWNASDNACYLTRKSKDGQRLLLSVGTTNHAVILQNQAQRLDCVAVTDALCRKGP